MKRKENNSGSGLKIIPLGGLEQIGMNITAFEYEDSIVVPVRSWLWTAVFPFRRMTCWESTW